jgi:hypothetical protein
LVFGEGEELVRWRLAAGCELGESRTWRRLEDEDYLLQKAGLLTFFDQT